MPDWFKIVMLVPIYLAFAPLVGFAIRRNRPAQCVVFFLMLFGAMLQYRWISTSPGFPQDFFYRGHTRGFECTAMEVMAVILIFAGRGTTPLRGPWLPPGIWMYLLYCGVAALSIFNSPQPSFTMMAIVKFTKITLVAVAAFHFLRQEKDIRFWLTTIAVMMMVQALVCLVFKYVHHVYQVRAWFEHQNSMSMFTYMLALPLLAAAMAKTRTRTETFLYGGGYVAAGICIFCGLSRLSMLTFAAGTALVVLLSLRDKMTSRRVMVVVLMGGVGLLGLLFSADTIISRFQDEGNVQSKMTRNLLNEASRKMISDHPFLGTGWNTYGIMINPPYAYGDIFDDYAHMLGRKGYRDSPFGKPISESWYYLVMAETGLPSIVALLTFILTTLYWCGRQILYYRGTFLGAVAIGLFAGLGFNYLQCNLERVLTQPKNMVAWMVCLGVVARMEWWRRQELRGRQPVWRTNAPAGPTRPAAPAPAPSQPARPPPPEPVFNPTPARVQLPPPSGPAKPRISILPPVS